MFLALMLGCEGCKDPVTDDQDSVPLDDSATDSEAQDDTGWVTPTGEYDGEPNDTREDAIPLPYGGGGRATVGGEDAEDWFVVHAAHAGELRVWTLEGLVEVELSTEGRKHYIQVSAEEEGEYALLVDFLPDPSQMDEVDPLVVGETAELRGSGFGTESSLIRVTIDGVEAPILSADDDRLTLQVPYGARSGELRLSTGGHSTEPMEVSVDAPDYPDEGLPDATDLQSGPDGDYAPGQVFAQAESWVDADTMEALAGEVGGTLSGWSRHTNLYQIAVDADEVEELQAIAEELMAHEEIVGAGLVEVPEEPPGSWDSSPFYETTEEFYASHTLTGLAAAWRLVETYGGPSLDPVQVAWNDTGLQNQASFSCPISWEPYPASSGGGPGFRLFLPDENQIYTESASFVDPGDTTPSACDGKDGHGTACTGILAAVGPESAGIDGANGALAGFRRAGVDLDLIFRVDVYATRQADGTPFSKPQMYSALAEIGAYPVIGINWGGRGGSQVGDPFANRFESVFTIAAHNYSEDVAGWWPTRRAVHDHTLVVGAVYPNSDLRVDESSWGSNLGPGVNIAAPTYIQSVYGGPNTFMKIGGTSAATPFLTAAVALVRWLLPDLQSSSVAALVKETGTEISTIDQSWQRNGAPLSRVHWTRLVTSTPILEQVEAESRPLMLVADREFGALRAYPLDTQTGLPTEAGSSFDAGCLEPVDLQISPDGARVAVLCSRTDNVVILSLHSFEIIGEVELRELIGEDMVNPDIGIHNRTWMSDAGILYVPGSYGGQTTLSMIDVYREELLGTRVISEVDGSVAWGIAPLEHGGNTLALLTSQGDAGHVLTVESDPREREFGTVTASGFGDHYPAEYPTGIALSPDGSTLAVTFSGVLSDTELVDVPVTGGSAQVEPGKGYYLRAEGVILERPYDVVWAPETGLFDNPTLFVPSWADDALVVLEKTGSDYPEAWQVTATYEALPSSNPERVTVLQNGQAVYMSSWNGNVSILSLPLTQSGVDLPFTTSEGGFGRPVGVTVTPLVSIVHPRHLVHPYASVPVNGDFQDYHGLLEPVFQLRSDAAASVMCIYQDENGNELARHDLGPLPRGFHHCPGLATDTTRVIVEVLELHDDGEAPLYRAEVRTP